ncbi:MAG: TldD/PmbA family protein [Planctomycetes bacterium]|nr:TldD/PmbA family protein [Planctomycetota bacterium]
MDQHRLFDLCDRVLQRAAALGADEAEIAALHAGGGEVSFEKNDLNVALTDEETSFGLRLYRGGRQGFATSNDPERLDELVADAFALAGASIADPLQGLPEPRALEPVADLHDPALAELEIGALTELAATLLEGVRSRDPRASIDSGSCSASSSLRVIANSKGLRAAESSTGIGCSLFGMAVTEGQVGSFVVEGRSARRLAGFREEIEACAARFADKAVALLDPGRGRSYRGRVLLAPEATASFLTGNLLAMLSPAAIRKGKSPVRGEEGEEIAARLVELIDRPREAGRPGASAFDREGMPKADLVLLREGRLVALPYDHYEARAVARPGGSTGHAGGGVGSTPLVAVGHASLKPGGSPLAEIMAEAEGAVVVSRFSGSTNAVTGEFSGVVKGGFLVDQGQLRPITEILIAGNLLELYRSVLALSIETERLHGRLDHPWVLLDGVSVTAG